MREKNVLIHLDMKGFPPTPERLLELIPVLKNAGFSGILFEFSDMFPWESDRRFRNETFYPEEVISGIGSVMKKHRMETGIHLNFFHAMEFMLGIGSYRYLSETGYERLNPSAVGSRNFAEGLLEEVFSLLPETAYVCIGGLDFASPGDSQDQVRDDPSLPGFLEGIRNYAEENGALVLAGEPVLPFRLSGSPSWQDSIVAVVSPEHVGSGGLPSGRWKAVHVKGDQDEDRFRACVGSASGYLNGDRTILMFPTRPTHHAPQLVPFEILVRHLIDPQGPREAFEPLFWDFCGFTGSIWRSVRSARELLTMVTRDGRRRHRHSNDISFLTKELSDKIDRARTAGDQLTASMKRYCEEYWVRIFIRDLIEPAYEELMLIRARIPTLEA